MYEKLNSDPMPTKQAEHLAMATDMANALMDRFEPNEQNEALKHFHMLIKERRQQMIDDADKKAAWLKETFQQL